MSYRIADNILSPLGASTEENYSQVLAGKSSLQVYTQKWGIDTLVASLFSAEQRADILTDGLSFFESLAYRSAKRAVESAFLADKDFRLDERVVFILSSTKGNIVDIDHSSIIDSAGRVARRLGVITEPIVVCNACVSGLSAMILADRLLTLGYYDYAIVCGAEEQSEFIASGFNSFKVLSPEPCRPFDIDRNGLNVGEAAATVVLSSKDDDQTTDTRWHIVAAGQSNDAFHISMPARNGDGMSMALSKVVDPDDASKLAFINAHGTATLFNDQMEAVAFAGNGLEDVKINALKGIFGHTMGACGVLETILSARALCDGKVLPTQGYSEHGVSASLNISVQPQATEQTEFVKVLAGFGGCNAAIRIDKASSQRARNDVRLNASLTQISSVTITPTDGSLTDLYKKHVGDYPKFYKMSGLCKLAFIASELLPKEAASIRQRGCGVMLFNRSSSVETDRKYLSTISDAENYYPSPSLFVYTLPNIAIGEIAIRNGIKGETCLYILSERNTKTMEQIVRASCLDSSLTHIITGWVDYTDENNYIADIQLIKTH